MVRSATATRESFIPLRRSDLVGLCSEQSGADRKEFGEFCEILLAYLHHEFLDVLDRAKDAYAPFNPDRDTLVVGADLEAPAAAVELTRRFTDVLSQANYLPISDDDIDQALSQISLIPLQTHVDFTDYADYALYYRGKARRKVAVRRLLKTVEVEIENYERVAMMLRFKDKNHFDAKSGRKKEINFRPGMAYLFLYKNVPKQDLELLFPNVQVWMTWKDRFLFVGPLLAGLGPMIIKILPSLGLLLGVLALYTMGPETARTFDFDEKKHLAVWPIMVAVLSSSMLLVGFAVKQFLNYKNKKLHFLKRVTETLFFKNLVSNRGVLMTIVDSAEEELGKEMIVAYHCLVKHGPTSTEALDGLVEEWLREYCGRNVDFDIGKALERLSAIKSGPSSLVFEIDGKWHATPLEDAKRIVDKNWDDIFSFSARASEVTQEHSRRSPV